MTPRPGRAAGGWLEAGGSANRRYEVLKDRHWHSMHISCRLRGHDMISGAVKCCVSRALGNSDKLNVCQ